ncbi:MAG TPA: hypothetical protein VLE96_05150 [Chlamydiales bacterium]|nr:hypothetical protein [Chlamydiales bacterium]
MTTSILPNQSVELQVGEKTGIDTLGQHVQGSLDKIIAIQQEYTKKKELLCEEAFRSIGTPLNAKTITPDQSVNTKNLRAFGAVAAISRKDAEEFELAVNITYVILNHMEFKEILKLLRIKAEFNRSQKARKVRTDGATQVATDTKPEADDVQTPKQSRTMSAIVKDVIGIGLVGCATWYVSKNIKNGNIKATTPYRFVTDMAIQVATDTKPVREAGMQMVQTIAEKLPQVSMKAAADGGNEAAGVCARLVTSVVTSAKEIFAQGVEMTMQSVPDMNLNMRLMKSFNW